MKLVVDIPKNTLQRVRDIVQTKDYDGPAEFVVVALENQIELESSEGSSGSIQEIGEHLSSDNNSRKHTHSTDTSTLEHGDYSRLTTCTPPKDDRLKAGPLWGQYNRIFPVKIIVRGMANTLNRKEARWTDLDGFQEDIASAARDIGLKLQDVDSELERGRGEKLASGLPVGEEPAKSIRRFKEQFVGRTDRENRLRGACPELKFVDITSEGKIGLTDSGLEFAGIENPLLDTSLRTDTALSRSERQFYLDHVSNHLPQELEAMLTVAESIKAGDDRPDSLTAQIAQLNGEWTDAEANTMRTGLASRMFELGLLTRERVGQRGVAYKLTEEGDTFISQHPEEAT